MKTISAILSLLSLSAYGLEQKNLYLKAGIQGGVPMGLGVSARAAAYFFNMEGGASYGYFLNTVRMGFGLRVPIGERNEVFLNLGGNRVYSKNIDLNLSGGPWIEVQHERKFGRNGFSTLAGIGVGLFPEKNEKNIVYALPTIKFGVMKAVFGY